MSAVVADEFIGIALGQPDSCACLSAAEEQIVHAGGERQPMLRQVFLEREVHLVPCGQALGTPHARGTIERVRREGPVVREVGIHLCIHILRDIALVSCRN